MKKLITLILLTIHLNSYSRSQDTILISTSKVGAKFRKTPDPLNDPLNIFPDNKQIIILNHTDDGYFKVKVDSVIGYINEFWIQKNENIENYLIQKKYGQFIYNKIKNGNYWIGMTEEMAILSLGKPKQKNRSVGSWGTQEQWIYDNKFLYFQNGSLQSYQDKK